MLFSALMAIAVFGGTMMIGGVRNGLDTVKSRLGADIMVTPERAKNEFDAQTVLLKAEPGYFYMDASVLTEIRRIEGVETASPQLFLASARAGCCSTRVQMIAFDPATDFTIQPWLKDTHVSEEMGLMDVVIGSTVDWTSAAYENIIRFYDMDCNVIGQFAPTGSTLDSAVYMNFDTCKALIRACRDKGMFRYEGLDADAVISSVMIRVKPGYEAESVATAIREQVEGVSVATATNMVSGVADSLNRISGTVSTLILVFWAIGTLMTVLIFTLMMNERKREFASLRAMGASRGILSGIMVKEALLVNLLGGVIGIAAAAVILFSFSGLIGQSLGAGFVLPSAGTALLYAALALLSVLAAAGLSAWITVRKVNQMDASLILKEGA
jgi:putative ABC transport system permease protein